jgi:short-subunit dehydrogenase
MRHLSGKRALITGAASGIGRALALRLAAEHVDLDLVDIDQQALAQTVGEARSWGVEVIGRVCDLSDPRQTDALAEAVARHARGIDLLVNNAGIAYYGHTDEMDEEHMNRLLRVNLLAPLQLTRALLPTLLQREEAHVLNVASICGLVGLGRVAAYTTAKFGLVGFSESLRAEYGRRGLGVTALCPGFVDTRLFETAPVASGATGPKLPPRWMLTSPQRIAHRAVRAIHRDQAVVVVQPYAHLLHLVKRWAPGLLDRAHRVSRRRHRTKPAQVVERELQVPARAA